jgi:hypothetical protein
MPVIRSVSYFTFNKRQTDVGVFVIRDLNQCATTGCLISHDREDLYAPKNILSSRVKNDKSHLRRKKIL